MSAPQSIPQPFNRDLSPLSGSSPSYSRYPSPASTSITTPCTSPKQLRSTLQHHHNPSGYPPPISTAADPVIYGSPSSPYAYATTFSQSPGSPYHYGPNRPYSPSHPGGFKSEHSPYATPLSPACPPFCQTKDSVTSPRPISQAMDEEDDGDGIWYTRDGRPVRYAGMHMDCATM
ncbi:hypothetical protein BJ508DRAFT_321707 [Ascobolus immersus RN42]|uniref:Uncharacterized protein n=1 Tax=Ascobolus immersus RN42 TaxID=1160509 RepID=A0A3N4IQT1_ASCIM|nr:hypothetical protein BJ508DRAFT_321707 [Ascobolus immersus RN42]